MQAWWRSYFGDDFFRLHRDLFPEHETRREVAAMIELLGLPVGARILDVPCGWGRHARLLGQAGFDVVAADLSVALLRQAAAQADRGPLRGLVACDLRTMPFAPASFDGVLDVCTSLGLFLDDHQDLAALREIHRVLKPGGTFLLESMHRDDVITDFAERDQWVLPDGTEVRVRRRFDPVRGVSYEQLRWRRGRESGRKQHALRLRTATEIDTLLVRAGFRGVRYWGGWDGRQLTHRSPHVIAVASRAE
jgi:ubiquinone/menaquinone biosynthesis C-methylase UbiE